MRSIDPPRRRPAPKVISGRRGGKRMRFEFVVSTLVIAVKSGCRACDEVLRTPAEFFAPFTVLYVAADGYDGTQVGADRVLISSSALRELDIRWPPSYAIIDSISAEVVLDGVIFDAAQVRDEIAAWRCG